MQRLLISCAAMLMTGSALGQIFECVDAKGNKEYTQVCPPGTVKETRLMKGGGGAATSPANAAPAKSLADQDAQYKKRTMERQEAEARSTKEKAETKDAERNCSEARAQYRALQDGQRISRTDPATGERSYLGDQERQAEMANTQRSVETWCNKK